MKTKLIILFALICFAFSATDLKAQTCPGFYVRNSTPCKFNYNLVWDCSGTPTPTGPVIVLGMSANFENNPGTWPNCCTFLKIGFMDCNGNWVTLDPGNPSVTICDCTGATVTIDLVWNGTDWEGAWIH